MLVFDSFYFSFFIAPYCFTATMLSLLKEVFQTQTLNSSYFFQNTSLA